MVLSDFRYRLRRFLYQEFIPVTKTVAIITGVLFLLSFIRSLNFIFDLLYLIPSTGFLKPWTLVTYPFAVNQDILSVVFGVLWFWMVGGSLERSWGSRTYGLFLFLVTLVTGVAMSLLGLLNLAGNFPVNGLWLPLVGLTWAWAAIGPDQEVLFMVVIPMKARVLAWIEAIITFLIYFQMGSASLVNYSLIKGLLAGLASISGIAVTYLFTGKGPLSRGYRYWAWKRKAAPKGRGDQKNRRTGRGRLRVIK